MKETKMTLKECIRQLESCNFECEAGKLECNIAFKQLKDLVERVEEVYNTIESQDLNKISPIIRPIQFGNLKQMKFLITGKCLGIEQEEELKNMGYTE